MSKYQSIKVNISDGQKAKLKRALSNSADSVTIKLGHEDLNGDDVIALTKTQINKLARAYEAGKGLTIRFGQTQLKHNLKVEGGIIPLLAAAIPALIAAAKFAVPAIATGALSGAASYGVQKSMGKGLQRGAGLYLKKGGCICQIETDGKGLYLGPATGKGLESVGDGLYLKKQGGVYDGRGLLLGPNSPFKNIPILGYLL